MIKIKKLFFIAYGGGHMNMILPIYRFFSNQKKYKTYVFALTSAIYQCEKENIPYLSYKDFIDDKTLKSYKNKYKNEISENHNSNFRLTDTTAYIGENLNQNEALWGISMSKFQYKLKGRHSFFPINFFKRVLNKIKPDILISTNSPKSEYASVIAANSLGITTISIDDLLGESFYPLNSTIVCANSKYSVPSIVSKGIDPNKIIVTGNPHFDSLFSLNKKINEQNEVVFLSQSGIKNIINNQFVVFSSEFYKNLLETLNDFLIKIDKKLIIRLHPNENIDLFKKVFNNLSFNLKVDESKYFINSLTKYSNFISFNSTALYEAYLTKRNIAELKIDVNYETFNLSSRNNINESIVSKNGKLKSLNFFKNKNEIIDGNNTLRVVSLIKKYLK